MTTEGLALRVLNLSFTVGLLPQKCRQDVCAPSYLHLLYPQSRQKSYPLACSSWPRHSGQTPIIVDMIATTLLYLMSLGADEPTFYAAFRGRTSRSISLAAST